VTDKITPGDEKIIEHLRTLKHAGKNYPVDIFKKRRASFRKETSGLILAGPGAGLLKGRFHFLAQIPAKSLEIILVSVLVAEVGLSAYLNRDQIKNWFGVETSTPTVIHSIYTHQPTLTGTPTATLTPTETRTKLFATPTRKTSPTNPGWHYGQTKTPKP